MNKKRIAQFCCAALVAAGIGLNIQNAIADYGIGENSLSLVATGGSGSGSSSCSDYFPSGGLGDNETYVITTNEECYELVLDQLLNSDEVFVRDENGAVIDHYMLRTWSRKANTKNARTTIKVKTWQVNWRPTSPVPFTETCASLNMKTCPAPSPISNITLIDYL